MSIKDKKLNDLSDLLDQVDSYSIRVHLSKLTCSDLIFLFNAIEKQLKKKKIVLVSERDDDDEPGTIGSELLGLKR
jgi:hypothetical protein